MSNESERWRVHGPGRDLSVLLVLSAPSGTGKTTIAQRLSDEMPDSVFSISCTTRPPRGTEQDGVDYIFLTDSKFRQMVQEDAFAEWAEVHGHFYGTPRAGVEKAMAEGKLVLFDIDVQGGEQLKARYPMAVTVLVLPPSYEELERRLRARGTDSDATIERRLLAARSEVRRGRSFDYRVINDDLEEALADIKAIIRAERSKAHRLDLALIGF